VATNPVVSFAAITPTTISAGQSVTFTNTSVNGGNISEWVWGFATASGTNSFYVGVGDGNYTYTFTNSGTYNVTLKGVSIYGTSTATTTSNNYVSVTGPVFSATPTKGTAPLTVTFTNQSVGATNYFWSFGDGNTSTSTNPVDIYTNAGTYSVTLQAVINGGTNVLTKTNYIVVNPPLVAFTGSPTNGVAPLTVSFANMSTNAAYVWNFGDGNMSTNANPVDIYTNAGTYTVALQAIIPGATNSLTRTNYIVVSPAPVANFSVNTNSGFAPLTVTFTNLSANATSYAWSFGDGGTSISTNPAYTYTNTGDYSVTLQASALGVTSTNVQTGYIHVFVY